MRIVVFFCYSENVENIFALKLRSVEHNYNYTPEMNTTN